MIIRRQCGKVNVRLTLSLRKDHTEVTDRKMTKCRSTELKKARRQKEETNLEPFVHESPYESRARTARRPLVLNHIASSRAAVHLSAVFFIPPTNNHVRTQAKALICALVLIVDLVGDSRDCPHVKRTISLPPDLLDMISHETSDCFGICC